MVTCHSSVTAAFVKRFMVSDIYTVVIDKYFLVVLVQVGMVGKTRVRISH